MRFNHVRSRIVDLVFDEIRPTVILARIVNMACSLGPRIESPGSWKCTWCGRVNVRERAGLDHCSACNAETFTFTGMENELRVRYSRRHLGQSAQ